MLNQIILMGRLTKDPEVRKIGEKQISKGWFTLAVDRPKYGDAQPQADFIPVVVWRSTAEFVGRNFHKGICRRQTADQKLGAGRCDALWL